MAKKWRMWARAPLRQKTLSRALITGRSGRERESELVGCVPLLNPVKSLSTVKRILFLSAIANEEEEKEEQESYSRIDGETFPNDGTNQPSSFSLRAKMDRAAVHRRTSSSHSQAQRSRVSLDSIHSDVIWWTGIRERHRATCVNRTEKETTTMSRYIRQKRERENTNSIS